MTEHEASRTLVKSPPELWSECSDAASLARHLGQFGEIRITRLEPESAVAWEGEQVSGTVRLEPSGWGTRVILTARTIASEGPHGPQGIPASEAPEAPARVVDEPPPPPEPDPDPQPEPLPPAAERPRGLMARLAGLFRPAEPRAFFPAAEPPAPVAPPDPPAPAAATVGPDHTAVLTAALDSLGAAHHRPFSRA